MQLILSCRGGSKRWEVGIEGRGGRVGHVLLDTALVSVLCAILLITHIVLVCIH